MYPCTQRPLPTHRDRHAATPSPQATVADMLATMGVQLPSPSAAAAASWPLARRRVREGESLVHEGAPAQSLYFVVGGSFKVFHTHIDGYEQVLAFAHRGDLLGFDALCMQTHPSAITALEASSVYVVPRSELTELGQRLPAFNEALQRAGSLSLLRSRELTDLMAAVAAEVRLARFLVQLSQRMAAAGQAPGRFRLSMSRRDVASLLGVAHETVSRSFGSLAGAGLVQVCDREIEIPDIERLKLFSRGTRRRSDDAMAQAFTPARGASRPAAPRRAASETPGRYRPPASASYAAQQRLAA